MSESDLHATIVTLPDGNKRSRVWMTAEKKWRMVAPVDAREMLAVGAATVHEPGTPEAEQAAEESTEPKPAFDFTCYPAAMLRAFCKQAGIEGPTKKTDMVAALVESGWRPDEAAD